MAATLISLALAGLLSFGGAGDDWCILSQSRFQPVAAPKPAASVVVADWSILPVASSARTTDWLILAAGTETAKPAATPVMDQKLVDSLCATFSLVGCECPKSYKEAYERAIKERKGLVVCVGLNAEANRVEHDAAKARGELFYAAQEVKGFEHHGRYQFYFHDGGLWVDKPVVEQQPAKVEPSPQLPPVTSYWQWQQQPMMMPVMRGGGGGRACVT